MCWFGCAANGSWPDLHNILRLPSIQAAEIFATAAVDTDNLTATYA